MPWLKARDSELREVVLTDVCPYTLGVDSAEKMPDGTLRQGIFSPIIERNTIVPASRERVFSPLRDGQRVVEFNVYQGESPNVTNNIKLGSLSVPLPRTSRADATAVVCRFSYDINGLLEVDVVVPQTGERRQLTIMDDETTMAAGELERRRAELARLKVHPRDEAVNRAAIARGERCYEEALGERREHIARCLSNFNAALETQDPRTVEAAREDFIAARSRYAERCVTVGAAAET